MTDEPVFGTPEWFKWLIAKLKDELGTRLRDNDKFDRPPQGFRALRATAGELERYGLPPRPDPETERDAYGAWQRLFGPEPDGMLNYLEFQPPALDDNWAENSYRLARGSALRAVGRVENSRNWSGAVAAVAADSQFKQIFGSWRVPKVKRPAGGADGDYRCSVWIGLDGHRRHLKSLAQLGTTQRVRTENGIDLVKCEAWYQWWLRDQKFPPIPFANFPVEPDDEIGCCLTVLSPKLVRFFIVNLTRMAAARVQSAMPTPQGDGADFGLRSVSAAWVAERPTRRDSHELHPLPDYGSVTIGDCVATMNNGHAPRGLTVSKRMRMIAERANPPRSAVISSAAKLDDLSVQTAFRA